MATQQTLNEMLDELQAAARGVLEYGGDQNSKSEEELAAWERLMAAVDNAGATY